LETVRSFDGSKWDTLGVKDIKAFNFFEWGVKNGSETEIVPSSGVSRALESTESEFVLSFKSRAAFFMADYKQELELE